MDDTQQSCTSEAAAAATRKRRSSILKSQRPPRTPFSELEFHVTTPPDTAKSRRVSFSRRTGVAEFITNEATTTWKTFYEEHNKSMESSGNESAMNPPRQTIGHLGKRMFDQQFQEVMAVDLISTNDNLSSRNVSNSFNNVNLTQQLAAFECNTGANLSLPQQKFEMSAVTDQQSKLFDDLAVPIMGEMSGKIDINFSAIQPIGTDEVKDDLDEIQEDLQRVRNNVVCAGPFTGGRDMSGYIEVDLNATHVTIPNDVSDMSITDTITSPKVQDANRNSAVNKSNIPKDWVEDKENIGAYVGCSLPVNPTNERRRTVVYENDTGNISITQAIPSNIILEEHKTSEKRKTIVYDSDAADISVTQAVPVNILITNKNNEKHKTIMFENDMGNISVTQAIPTNIIMQDKTKTIISEDDFGNISITQAVPSAKIISDGNENVNMVVGSSSFLHNKDNSKRKTIVYENEDANISETQVIPPNIMSTIEIQATHRKSPVKTDRNTFSNIELTNKRNTIVFDDDIGNISITQAVPTNIIVSKLHNRSNVQNLQEDCLKNKDDKQEVEIKDDFIINKRKTIVFDEDNNISITQAIPANIIISHAVKDEIVTPVNITTEIKRETQFDSKNSSLNSIQPLENRRRTVVFNSDNTDANMSITQALPHEKLIRALNVDIKHELSLVDVKNTTDTRRRTVVFDKSCENADMSITEALPRENLLDELNKISTRKSKDISLFNEIITNEPKRKTIVFDEDKENADMSITEVIPNEYGLKDLNKTQEQNKKSDLSHSNLNTDSKHINLSHDDIVVTEKLDTDNQNVSGIDNLPRETIYNITNKSLIHELSIKNRDMVHDKESNIIEAHNTIANMSIPVKLLQEDVIDDMRHEKSGHNNLTLPQNNESVTHKPNVSLFEKVNNTLFVSTMEVDDIITEDVRSNNINVVSMSHVSHKSVFVEQENSIIHEQLNKSELKNINHSVNKSIAQDILVYQAATHINVADKNSSHIDRVELEEFDGKRVSVRNYLSNESALEVDASIQMSETRFVKQNAESVEEAKPNTALKSTQVKLNQSKVTEKPKKSILDELLDMSSTSLDNSLDKATEALENPHDNASDESFIHVKDSDEETQTDNDLQNNRTLKCEKSILPLDSKEKDKPVNITNNAINVKAEEKLISPKNALQGRMHSADLEKSPNKIELFNKTEVKENIDESKISKRKSFRDANDTDELLEMLSDLTDNSRILKDDDRPKEAVKNTSHYPEVNEPRRLSVAPNRLSIVISREDLLNNISMAHAALQKSIEIDESLAESTPEESPQKKSNRISNEVAKKLEFDESDSETSAKGMKASPLTKTAFGESESTRDKAKVIPSYMNNVSLELKSLMNDLVKPNADTVPFEAAPDESPMKNPSTCSIQIQANLITSSQIDIDTEANSVIEPIADDERESSHAASNSFSSSTKTSVTEKRASREVSFAQSIPSRKSASESDRVIVFDHHNPLNNILLAPSDYSNVHKCDPSSEGNAEKTSDSDDAKPINKVHYNIESVLISQTLKQAGDSEMVAECISNESKSPSTRVCELKDTKVNTIIAMKGNKELLQASSSLTLVDDAVANLGDGLDATSAHDESPMKVIYKNEEDNSTENKDLTSADLTSADDTEQIQDNKSKKRNYSLTKSDKNCYSASNLDITPKPMSKILRLSNSPKADGSPQKLTGKEADEEIEVDVSRKEDKIASPVNRPGSDITVQQLITEYNITDGIDQEQLNKQILDALSRSESSTAPNTASVSDSKSPDAVSSFTSSKNQDEIRSADSVTTASVRTRDWNVDESSKSSVSECESSVNVVAKIDMLSFMGSHECEWEPSGIDTWSFRLLHARLRLIVRLAHRHDNAIRTRVRADTPVLNVALETAHADKKNSVALLCVGFAAEAMRYFVGQGCGRAGDVPLLLRRCAAVARLSLRWGRAMHDARQHLAYTLTGDGLLALKVANVPLRSVWEVTMRLELVVEDAREVPWPRACDVRVSRVVSDVRVTNDEVGRVLTHLPRDWGHAPRAIWKIFRYLKNKTRDDEILGLT